jgi:catechol 2,3-dioxygenase-like lactoylglutathione lyase family enzyme
MNATRQSVEKETQREGGATMKPMSEGGEIEREKRDARTLRQIEAGGQTETIRPPVEGFPLGWLILWFLLVLALLFPPLSRGQEPFTAKVFAAPTRFTAAPSSVREVSSVGMTVSDMDASVEFYSKVLSFEKISDVEVLGEDYEHLQGVFGLRMRVVRMRLGSEFIELNEYLTPKGRPLPVDSRSNDRWFQHIAIITSDMEKAYALLRQNKVEHASTGPQTLPAWNRAAGGIKAFYFRDPDRHWLEVLQFPAGKGDARWQAKDRLFLGIDHTAIVVSKTEASLKFYRDALGMRVAGESENYGTEQEHLNNVRGARLRITSLRAASGPGIEFLEYLAPRDGRMIPSDERPNDLSYWQTRLTVGNVGLAAQSLSKMKPGFISAGVITLREPALGFRRALIVRDPDGHAMQLIEK